MKGGLMEIYDNVYGIERINKKILVELIRSDSLQRLKDISQLGMPDEYSNVKGFSRYEHSVGVMILLKRLGAKLEEQVAGLLHDVSHTPFSHVIDWVLGDPTKEDYQDKIYEKFLRSSEIPSILIKHNLDVNFISNYHNFGLLEKDAPSLCADRIDYTLRQMDRQKEGNLVKKISDNLFVKENQIVFKDETFAKLFGQEYMNLQVKQWAGDEMRSRYYILSEILKKAFKENLISLKHLNGTEKPILKILNESKDDFILNNLNLLKKGFKVISDENGIELKKKFRYIDPEVIVNGSYFPLSKLSEEYFTIIKLEKEKSKEENKIKIIPN
jgi:uncharacterized protein